MHGRTHSGFPRSALPCVDPSVLLSLPLRALFSLGPSCSEADRKVPSQAGLFVPSRLKPRPWVVWRQDLNSCQTIHPRYHMSESFVSELHKSELILEKRGPRVWKMFGTSLTLQKSSSSFYLLQPGIGRVGETVNLGA